MRTGCGFFPLRCLGLLAAQGGWGFGAFGSGAGAWGLRGWGLKGLGFKGGGRALFWVQGSGAQGAYGFRGRLGALAAEGGQGFGGLKVGAPVVAQS